MRKYLFIFIAQLCFSLLAFSGPKDSLRIEKRDAQTFIIHRVIKNEGLPQLAKRYGVSESEILSSNPLLTDKPFAGQLLKIPLNKARYGDLSAPEVKPLAASFLPVATTLPAPSDDKKATTKPSETLTTQVSEEVKGSGKKIVAFNTYVVSSPQTVQQVANSFSVEANDIIRENDLQNYRLKAGQKIKIPIYEEPIAAKSVQTVTKNQQKAQPDDAPVVAAKPKVEPAPQAIPKVEQKPKLEPEPKPVVVAKPKPEPKPVIAANPKPEPKPEPKPVVAAQAKPDTTLAQRKRTAAMSNIDLLDSTYTHPDGVAYKLFDYRQMDYQFDIRSMRMAEENAIVVEGTDQRPGYGNKKTIHVVKREESIQSIAQKYRVSATDIINWNGLLSFRVREGQELIINSDRANMSPYERTVVTQTAIKPNVSFYERTVKGFAYYDAKKTFKGVYVNDVAVGKFITIQNRDTYEKTIAKVIGPLPAGLPKGTIIMIDTPTAKDLKVENDKVNIQIWINTVADDPEAAAQESN